VLRPGEPPEVSEEWAARVRAGRALVRALAAADLAAVAARLAPGGDLAGPFLLTCPKDGPQGVGEGRYRRLLAGAALDGLALVRRHEAGELADLLGAGLAPERRQALDATLARWRGELDRDWGVGAPAAAWLGERLEYRFRVAAPPFTDGEPELVLGTDEYDGDGLAWFSVDLDPDASLGATADAVDPGDIDQRPPTRGSFAQTLFPAPLTYPGAPADRFWEMEDAAVSLGALGAGPTDLAKMLAVDFAIVYSPDWFLLPLEVPVGAVARIDWVIVRDTFGHATLVGTTESQRRDGQGRQFQPSRLDEAERDDPLLVVLPSALGALRSEPIEDVALQRDEVANLVWGIERRVQGPSGRGVDQPWFASDFALPELSVPVAETFELIWRFATPIAGTWIPYVAAIGTTPGDPPRQARYLRRARLLDTADAEARGARSYLLRDAKKIREEEVTRAGCRLTLGDQLARGFDGSVHVWRGRSKRPGRGEASSGLNFDSATPAPSV